jgi:hypothetical protein
VVRAFRTFHREWSRLEHDYFVDLLVSNTHHIIAKDEHTTCDLVMDSSNTEWRNYTQAEQHNIEQVAACLDKIGHTGGSPNGAEGEEPTRKLHCPTEVTLDIVRSTIKQYDTVWFGGDSVMKQQFYTLACILDPSMTSLTNMSSFWHHSTNHSNRTIPILELHCDIPNLAGFLITMNKPFIEVTSQWLLKVLVQTMPL